MRKWLIRIKVYLDVSKQCEYFASADWYPNHYIWDNVEVGNKIMRDDVLLLTIWG